MLINDVLYSTDYSRFSAIGEECHQFCEESGGIPMVKLLPREGNDLRKVKVRKRKNDCDFTDSFNEVFEHEIHQLRERALFANGEFYFKNNINTIPNIEPFFIFPIDGYDYIYSKEVTNSSKNYSSVFNEIYDQLGESSTDKVFSDLIKFSYTSTNLHEGLASGAEIITYGIPYYYAVRKTSINDYKYLLTTF